VLRHAHARSPADRYPNLSALAADLWAILASRPVSVEDPSLAHLARLWLRRHRRGVSVGGATAALALLAGASLWVFDARAQHASILADLARIAPASFLTAGDFEQSVEPLLELRRRTEEFEASSLRGLVYGGLRARVAAAIDDWSRGLARHHAAYEAECRALGIPLQEEVYRRLFWEESVLCPDCPYNLDNRRRGFLRFPAGALEGLEVALDVLTKQDGPSPELYAFVFRPTFLGELLTPGTYRLQAWPSGATRLALETVLFVPPGWPAEQPVELNPPCPELIASAIPVPRGTQFLGGLPVCVPGFRIRPHLVTIAEFDEFRRACGLPPIGVQSSRTPTDPVWVHYDYASAYAAWVGGRLPSRHELKLAVECGAIPMPQPNRGATGEYLLEMLPADELMPAGVPYRSDDLTGITQASRVVTTVSQLESEGELVGAGFRVVFADDDPEHYRRAADSPTLGARRGQR
jgi:hypothetical protein